MLRSLADAFDLVTDPSFDSFGSFVDGVELKNFKLAAESRVWREEDWNNTEI
jgi:hypothetical protein